jgi:metallo-beta-lactamase family protein
MRASFHGAARTVTGSATLVESAGTRVLVDCGQFQGDDDLERRNREPFGFDPRALDAVVLTHAHVDHVGRAPALLRQGFRGAFVSTRATAELAAVMLLDSAKIAEEDARRGGPPPSFDEGDVERLYRRTKWLRYGETSAIGSGISVTLSDAGHILGSAHVLLTLSEGGRTVRFGLSGDVGSPGRPVVSDPTPFRSVDHVQVETTYGDRDHRSGQDSARELLSILESVEASRGVALVPAFALGRTQDVLYHVARWKGEGRLSRLDVYVDSPLAMRLTDVFRRNAALFDDDTKGLLAGGNDPFDSRGLTFVQDARESERLARSARGALVIASSGMCQGGRILGHLEERLPLPSTDVVIVGYQAPGTLGRRLVDRATTVRVRGREVPVRARVHTLGGFSAHAGKRELLDWLAAIRPPPKTVFLVHGEPRAQDAFARDVLARIRTRVAVPEHGEAFDL